MTIRKTEDRPPRSNSRLRRPAPERTSPLRAWPEALRPSDSSNGSGPSSVIGNRRQQRANPKHADGLELGYAVIQAHMRQAESIARKYSSARKTRATAGSADLQNTVARLFQSVTDLAPIVSDLVNSIASSSLLQPPATERSASQPGAEFVPANSQVAVQMRSPRPVAVDLFLRPDAATRDLVISGLYAPGSKQPTIKNVQFSPASKRKKASLRIRTPLLRIGLTYSGLLIDHQSGKPMGILSIQAAE